MLSTFAHVSHVMFSEAATLNGLSFLKRVCTDHYHLYLILERVVFSSSKLSFILFSPKLLLLLWTWPNSYILFLCNFSLLILVPGLWTVNKLRMTLLSYRLIEWSRKANHFSPPPLHPTAHVILALLFQPSLPALTNVAQLFGVTSYTQKGCRFNPRSGDILTKWCFSIILMSFSLSRFLSL